MLKPLRYSLARKTQLCLLRLQTSLLWWLWPLQCTVVYSVPPLSIALCNPAALGMEDLWTLARLARSPLACARSLFLPTRYSPASQHRSSPKCVIFPHTSWSFLHRIDLLILTWDTVSPRKSPTWSFSCDLSRLALPTMVAADHMWPPNTQNTPNPDRNMLKVWNVHQIVKI